MDKPTTPPPAAPSDSAAELMEEIQAPTPEKHAGGSAPLEFDTPPGRPAAAPLHIEPGSWDEAPADEDRPTMKTGNPGGLADRYADDDAPAAADEPTRLTPETTTELYVGALDFLQTQVFKAIELYKAKNRIAKADDSGRDRAAAYTHALELLDKITNYNADLQAMPISDQAKVRIMQRATLRIEKLPFTEDEFDKMAEALELIIKEMPEYRLPPSFGFALAVGHAILPRAVDAVFE